MHMASVYKMVNNELVFPHFRALLIFHVAFFITLSWIFPTVIRTFYDSMMIVCYFCEHKLEPYYMNYNLLQ